MLSIQSKNWLKTCFQLVPSWRVDWLDTSAETFFYQPKTWMMKLSRRFWSCDGGQRQRRWHQQQQTIILLLSTKDLGGWGRSEENGFHAVNSMWKLTENLLLVVPSWRVDWLDTLLPKPSFITQRIGWWNLVGDYDSAAAASGSGSGSGSSRLSFFFYQPKIWGVGVDLRRWCIMLSIQSKNWLKTCF